MRSSCASVLLGLAACEGSKEPAPGAGETEEEGCDAAEVPYAGIENNDALTDLASVAALEYVGSDISIVMNGALATEAAQAWVDGIDYVGGDVKILGNAP